MKPYEILNHGIENSQYFSGCGTYGTPYLYCATGIGSTTQEAYEDAVELVYQTIDDAQKLKLPKRIENTDDITYEEDMEDFYCHVSIRFVLQ
jgi:hypothetical protein